MPRSVHSIGQRQYKYNKNRTAYRLLFSSSWDWESFMWQSDGNIFLGVRGGRLFLYGHKNCFMIEVSRAEIDLFSLSAHVVHMPDQKTTYIAISLIKWWFTPSFKWICSKNGRNPTTGLSKRNGAKLRESFCLAAASHSRPRQAGA